MALGVFVALDARPAFSANAVVLAWDASVDPTVTGYNLYYGAHSGAYTNAVNAGGATSTGASNLVAGATYYFAATSYNAAGLESDYSSEVSYTVPASTGNQPPTMNPIINITLNENAGAQGVNLAGITAGSGTGVSNLTITATSSKPSLIPNPTVAYTYPGTTATLTFVPVANSYGSNNVTVLLDNGGAVSNTLIRSFSIIIAPVNVPPTLNALAPMVINENSGLQTVPLSGISSGSVSENQALTVTAVSSNPGLIPNPAVTYTSANTSGSLTFAPLTNTFGSSTITVTVNDGQPVSNLFARNFTVTVNQVAVTNQPPTTNTSGGAWTLYWQNTSGAVALWSMNGTNSMGGAALQPGDVGTTWRIVGNADLNGDGKPDLIFESIYGDLAAWFMDGTNRLSGTKFSLSKVDPSWKIVAVTDLDGDGKSDLLWENDNGSLAYWLMDGTNYLRGGSMNPARVDPSWRIVGTADLNADGHTDLLWQNSNGSLAYWAMNGTNYVSGGSLSLGHVDPSWKIVGTADINGDGHTALIWQNSNGTPAYWSMNGTNYVSGGTLHPSKVDASWRVMGAR